MGKVRVIYEKDGTVSVVHPVKKSIDQIDACLDRATPDDADYDDIDSSELPGRDKRYAWRKGPKGGVIVDENASEPTSAKRDAIDKLKALGLTESEASSL